jgi:hypothetical protein
MTNYYREIVLPETIIFGQSADRESAPPKINAHIHTPHSFSAFDNMEQPFEMANSEHIVVLGINDFYTTDGYDEFASLAKSRRIFPLFNIEFMALQKNEQAAGMRINDPQNPGRTYLSGKGLRYPVVLSDDGRQKLQRLQSESNRQTYQMVDKLNQFLETTSTGIHFDAEALQDKLARNLFRERHIATAVRIAVVEKFVTEENIFAALTEIFSGKAPKSSVSDVAALENEIRNNLLKAGGPAYVAEDEKAFLSLGEVIEFIIDAGGIPCYPVLLDDAKGNFTDFEGNFQMMANSLKGKGIFMIELIPGRNDYSILKDFVRFFDQLGFGITFGSEHNTPQLDPLTITCRGGIPLDDDLMQISYKGAALIAAHQYLIANGKPGFPVHEFPSASLLTELEGIGKQVIMNFIK